MIVYAIRHKLTGKLMPQTKRNRGYSHWNPSTNKVVDQELNIPRILESKKQAERCIVQWNTNPNGRYKLQGGNYWDEPEYDLDIKPDGRKKEDLEVVKIILSIGKL